MAKRDVGIREWSSQCPECKSRLVWSMSKSEVGSEAKARCSKSAVGSVITTSLRNIRFCAWEGKAVRQSDGSVRIKNQNGLWIR